MKDFAQDKRILEWVSAIIGDSIEFHQTKYNPKAPSEKGEKWDPHRGDTFWCFKDGVPDPKKLLSVFIALTEQTEENRAVYVWKGSHTVSLEEIKSHIIGMETDQDIKKDTASYLSLQISPKKLKELDENFEKVLLTSRPGTVWFIDAGLLHASQANKSTQERDLVANVFRTTDNRPKHPRPESYLSEPPNGPL